MDDEPARTVMPVLEKRLVMSNSILSDSSFHITLEEDCGCYLCETGMPGKDGYRPHTVTSNCWCVGAEYYRCCEVVKQFGVT